jgi:hypothetical protein
MDTHAELKQAAALKRLQSAALSDAYSATLFALAPANFVLVVGAALLALMAGAGVLVENDIITKTESGVLALISSALTIVHSKFGCDEYQAECKKLRTFYRGMAEDYDGLQFISDDRKLRKRFIALNGQLSAAAKSASALPFKWVTAKDARA